MSDKSIEPTEAAVAGWIIAYLCDQRTAADTVRGVREWWLRGLVPGPSEALVLTTLDELEQTGLVCRVVTSDNTTLWTAGRSFSASSLND